jgi:hypothetical protein
MAESSARLKKKLKNQIRHQRTGQMLMPESASADVRTSDSSISCDISDVRMW